MNKVTTAIAASGIAIASVAVGMGLQAALYDMPQRESNITAEPARKPVNPNALPGVEAPTNRTDPTLEGKVVAACNVWADVMVRTYNAALKGVDRKSALYGLYQTIDKDDREFYKNVIKEGYYVIYDSKYQYTREQLHNYVYQVCDLDMHRIMAEKMNEVAK